MTKENLKINDALKIGSLQGFRAYHACRCNYVGQVLPDNKIKRHSRMSLSGIPTAFNNTQGGDPRTLRAAFSGMTTHFKEEALNKNTFRAPLRSGFTLIELLVVILIIGILAAVALPQYQKAVEQARTRQVLVLVKSVVQAQKLHFLTHGTYAATFDQLDLAIPWTGHEVWDSHGGDIRSNGEWSLSINGDFTTGGSVGLGRLTGPYKGSGFRVYLRYPGPNGYKENVLYCIEPKSLYPILYSKARGTYCEKIWKGTLKKPILNNNAYFELPYHW